MTTTDELTTYYSDLLIMQYAEKEKAIATVKAVVNEVIMDQLPLDIQDAFNVETAVGVQLDMIGKYAGVTRNVRTISEYIELDDADFRTLIKMVIVQNNAGSSLYDIQNLVYNYLNQALSVFDYQNMTMFYYFNSAYGSEQLAEVFVRQGLLPKPMGVQLGALVYINNITNVFGFRTYLFEGTTVSGFNTYGTYHTDRPWISYANAIA